MSLNKIAIILSAGNQTRFNSNIPKSLYPLKNNLSPMDLNIDSLIDNVDLIYIITSTADFHYFEKYNNNKVKVKTISSGFGCGDALLKSLYVIDEKKDDIILLWGDSIQTKEKVNLLIENSSYDGETFYVPVVKEKKPYVQFIPNEHMNIKNVRFSKYKDKIDEIGYHDLSIFRLPLNKSVYFLEEYKKKYKKYNNKNELIGYTTRSNEFTFLDIFNEFENIKSKIIDLSSKNIIDLSYNTIEEFNKIKEKI